MLKQALIMFEAFAMELRMQKPVYLLPHHESPQAQGLELKGWMGKLLTIPSPLRRDQVSNFQCLHSSLKTAIYPCHAILQIQVKLIC